jgi:hypothetical protein
MAGAAEGYSDDGSGRLPPMPFTLIQGLGAEFLRLVADKSAADEDAGEPELDQEGCAARPGDQRGSGLPIAEPAGRGRIAVLGSWSPSPGRGRRGAVDELA